MRDAQHKLSKRDGDAYYEDFIAKGYLKEAIINYVALLGWNPGDDREFFTLDELIDAFDVSGMSKSPAIFDVAKLTWMNAEYIRRMSEAEFDAAAAPWYERSGIGHMDKSLLRRILQPRLEIFSQMADITDFLVKMDEQFDLALFTNKKSKTNPEISASVLDMAIPELESLPSWDEESLHGCLIGMAEANGMKNGTLLWPVRIGMAGKAVTPGGAIEIACLLGREESLRRLKLSRDRLKQAL